MRSNMPMVHLSFALLGCQATQATANPRATEPAKIDYILGTYTGAVNKKAYDIMLANDGKTVYLDKLSMDLAVDIHHIIDEKCNKLHRRGRPTNEIDGIAVGLVFESPELVRSPNFSCMINVSFTMKDKRPLPTSSGGTGVYTILIRKVFSVNVTHSGAFTFINLREN